MRLLVLCLSIPLLLLISCNDDKDATPAKEEPDSSFKTRQTVRTLEGLPGRIKFLCEDTAFIYLQTGDSAVLMTDDLAGIGDFFMNNTYFTWYPEIIPDHPDYACEILYEEMKRNLQDPVLGVSIFGSVKESLETDSLPIRHAKPFVIDTLIKVYNCEVQSSLMDERFPLQETEWRVIDVVTDSAVHHPSCEYSDVRIIFSSDTLDYDNQYAFLYIYSGNNTCGFAYKLDENQAVVQGLGCTLEFVASTIDVYRFSKYLFEALGLLSGEELTYVSYSFEDNLLILSNGETGSSRVRLFVEAD